MSAKATDEFQGIPDVPDADVDPVQSDQFDLITDEGDQLVEMRSELQELGRRFLRAEEQIASYLDTKTSAATQDFGLIAESQQQLDNRIDELSTKVGESCRLLQQLSQQTAGASCLDVQTPAKNDLGDELKENQLQIGKRIARTLREDFENHTHEMARAFDELRDLVRELTPDLPSPEPDDFEVFDATGSPDRDSAWMEASFGVDLVNDPDIEGRLVELRDRLLSGDPAVVSLTGRLMVFHSASPERRPQLLKDLGEAYYDCYPKTVDEEDVLEQALAASLQKSCEKAGFSNLIELVHPGERFDSARHSPLKKGGGQVAQVHGWTVLRDDGQVYTKASVSLQ